MGSARSTTVGAWFPSGSDLALKRDQGGGLFDPETINRTKTRLGG
jgi:hypothetical protein